MPEGAKMDATEPLRLPIPPCAVNPGESTAGHQLLSWAREMRLVTTAAEADRLRAMRLEHFAARVLPTAALSDLQLTTNWAAFICLVDDAFDTTASGGTPDGVGAVMAGLLRILEAEHLPGTAAHSPVDSALANLWAATAPHMSPHWQTRFIAHYRDFAEATREEALIRASGVMPELRTYLELRRRTITLLPMMDIVERTAHLSLPEAWLARPEVRSLQDTIADTVAWTNDLTSAGPELTRGHCSLIPVIRRHRGCSHRQAVEYVKAMILAGLRLFDRREAELLRLRTDADVPPEAGAYLGTLRTFLNASLTWQTETLRFEELTP
jgi:hypothetical protein